MFTNLILKKCPNCEILKPAGGFHKHLGRKFGLTDYCADCRNSNIIEKKYKLKPGQKEEILKKQNEVCGICKQNNRIRNKYGLSKNFAVDHCHNTGKVRGLLCTNCNTGLGKFKDNISFLENAIKYLKENNNGI